MKKITLSGGFVSMVDDDDYEKVSANKWTLQRGRKTNYAYRFDRTSGKNIKIYLHREIMNAPIGSHIDHIDGNGLNNQKGNMRKCSPQENSFNQRPRKNATSMFKGVSWHKKRAAWEAYIYFDYRKKLIGYYDSEVSAANAYDSAAKKHFGKFARMNSA